MLSRKKQKKYLSKKEKDWMVQLRAYGQSGDQEAIHRLRLGVKKVKAFVQLMKECSGSGRKVSKDFELLKKMFRQAGKIRDASNNLKLMEGLQLGSPSYREEQDRLRDAAAVAFQQQIPVYRKKGRKAGRHLLADVQNISTSCIRDWYAARLIKISVLLTASGDLLHEARKKIKELLYVQGLLPKELVEEIGLDRGYLDELQEALGQWHDMAVIATAHASRDGADGRGMFEECKRKEDMVRDLAKDFYRRAHKM